ncbi:alpha/beta hydrolase [Jatrophihabitans sp. DSM 44399]|uniref:Alpha/beta hydrolase n=2 Tax=Jatrophihabitans lederbergiae TaxID=3075547 RepID=A0ABU2JDS9_9ACTN|nr:alpha/beta hydrolase [Jatrophihabitans sp. DSM 44399]MDT0263147.1 alpha/beta hydrolase [Jatrophihabitans sp. DSM 44399]
MRDDVLGVLVALDLQDLVLVGHSMGGTVAYLVAQAQPGRIARLVVEDAPPPFPRERPVPARPAGELPFDWVVVPAIVDEVNDPSLRWWKHLPEITAPTLLVGGGPTSHVPQDLLVDVARAVPDCTLDPGDPLRRTRRPRVPARRFRGDRPQLARNRPRRLRACLSQ